MYPKGVVIPRQGFTKKYKNYNIYFNARVRQTVRKDFLLGKVISLFYNIILEKLNWKTID